MTATDASATRQRRPSAPIPEECDHPHPVRGIMAHEFSPYRGAQGPEGVRRTTMYYGPVVGGLPIAAWHCETCGLLRLEYPDTRKEERRLFPGPQPGLLASTVAEVVAPEAYLGMQPRVSGISVSPELALSMAPPAAAPVTLPQITIPSMPELVDGSVVAGLVATMIGLLLLGFGAVYDWKPAGWEGPVAVVTGVVFASVVLLKIGAASFTHFFPFPRLSPSPAEAMRGKPKLDAVAWWLVSLLVLMTVGLLLAGILAVYDWKPPDIERPIVFGLIGLFVVGMVLGVAGGAARALRGGSATSPDQT